VLGKWTTQYIAWLFLLQKIDDRSTWILALSLDPDDCRN
jgi:hypothetical protein